jgi:molybdopterin converting factor small subunit
MSSATTMNIKVLFFASAREAVGGLTSTFIKLSEEGDDSVANTTTLRSKLATLYPKLASLVLDEENITLALNEEYVPFGIVMTLKDGDTVALIPPISGG